jgi:alcohol dehydrogenase class IV
MSLSPTASFDFSLPTRVYAGAGALGKMADACAQLGVNFLLVTAPELKAASYKVVADFAARGMHITMADLAPGEPACHELDAAAAKLRATKFDAVIGLGGGSAIDAAKALAIALTQPEPVWMYANLATRLPAPLTAKVLPVVAVPTTSGTGSEVTPYAVLGNEETQQKGTVQQPEVFPVMSFVDPALTLSMPKHLSAITGFDALAHAMEAFINRSKAAPVAEWAAQEAMRLIFEHLPRAVNQPDNLDARSAMSWASTVAGFAISHRGTTTAHAIAEPLGAITHLPHGFCVAAATVPVMELTWRAAPESFARMHNVSGGHSHGSSAAKAEAFVERLRELLSSVALDAKALQAPLQKQGPKLADTVVSHILGYKFRPLKQHPVEFNEADLKLIVSRMIGH